MGEGGRKGLYQLARGGGRRLEKPPKSFDNVSLFIFLSIFQTNFVEILHLLPIMVLAFNQLFGKTKSRLICDIWVIKNGFITDHSLFNLHGHASHTYDLVTATYEVKCPRIIFCTVEALIFVRNIATVNSFKG